MAIYTPALREALNDSISSGKFADTKIILFSRRDSSGTIYKPRALYASSHVLRTVPYFNDLLFGTFAESESKNFSEPLSDVECAENYGYYPDSDLEEDDDSVNSKAANRTTPGARGHFFDPFCFLYPSDDKPVPACGEYKENLDTGKVVKIQDMALITFQAFLFYLYTGLIEFAPYGSENNRKSRGVEIVSVSEDSIPRPSPKSIYRLADKYDVPRLKQLAFDNIRDGLERCDIVEEVFSEFTSRYDEVRIIQVDHLASVRFDRNEETTKNLCDKIDEKVDAYANGYLSYAADAVSLLWEASKKRRHTALTPQAASNYGPQTPSLVNCVTRALIRSLREGVFVDRKYWARHSRTGKILRPVYLSSVVAGERLLHIDNLMKRYRSEDEYFNNGDGPEDSDCESDLDQIGHSTTEVTGKIRGRTISRFSPLDPLPAGGPCSSICARNRSNSPPLKSQGSDARTLSVREEAKREPHTPPPCSPKTIYSLAVALEINHLRDLALREIRLGITPANILDEFFSSSTPQRGGIMKMQYDLLSAKFDDHDMNTSVVGLIRDMADGSGAHRAGALKFGLREGFSLPRPKQPEAPPPPTPGVPLRRAKKKQGAGGWGLGQVTLIGGRLAS